MKKLIYYDKENDILSVHNGFSSDEEFKGNIDTEQFVLDVSTKDRIRGIEIFRASEFFKEFGVKTIESAELKSNGTNIEIEIKTKGNEIVTLPIQAPLLK